MGRRKRKPNNSTVSTTLSTLRASSKERECTRYPALVDQPDSSHCEPQSPLPTGSHASTIHDNNNRAPYPQGMRASPTPNISQYNNEPEADAGFTVVQSRNQRRTARVLRQSQSVWQDGTSSEPGSRLSFIRNNDWHTRYPEKQKVVFKGASTLRKDDSELFTQQGKAIYRPGPRTRNGILYEDLKPGTIIARWDVRLCRNPDSYPNWIHFVDEDGQQKVKKRRPYIITKKQEVGKGQFDLYEAAVYTNHNTGLRNVEERNKHKYLSLRPDHTAAQDFRNQNPEQPVLAVDEVKQKEGAVEGMLTRSTMVVNYMEIETRSIETADGQILGTLDSLSTAILSQKAFEPRQRK